MDDGFPEWESERRSLLAQRISELGLSTRGTLVERLAAFGPFTSPYRERYRVDPLSRDYVRHVLGRYAQKHPDEDFVETFAVWLTPDLDWRRVYAGWPALAKLEYVDRVMEEVGGETPPVPQVTADDLPVEAMHYTLGDHYRQLERPLPITDERHFDHDLRRIFGADAPAGPAAGTGAAARFLRQHERDLVRYVTYWTGEAPPATRALVDALATRAEALGLRAPAAESPALIEITAYVSVLLMNYRYSRPWARRPAERERRSRSRCSTPRLPRRRPVTPCSTNSPKRSPPTDTTSRASRWAKASIR